MKRLAAAVAATLILLSGCDSAAPPKAADAPAKVAVTISGVSGKHVFTVERAQTAPDQARGLMFRTDIPADGGMLFHPYPPDGGAPKAASFWMKNTPSPLDIIFIRADGTIARIAENTPPFSEAQIPSGEPVAAVLEIRGGRSADLDIAEGDTVRWPGWPKR
ncbi:DUF192 domain-containing protein [Sphingomonas immobilis]|uniref:DUF192 domain-containing protein n=1 Tax=Sphingomonas immobilis TaxID=3063997 RepID=A0ABT8ZWW5_9SPHN|nr:DUF192 domain-containing protein [Sphingomonas sp. CA1-15]MDO7842038.1 DUF192 domain-containing protein [Sphingomonas sp. CA1-15]